MPKANPDSAVQRDPETNRINLSWLLRLRTGEIIGQVSATLFADFGLGMALPLLAIFAVVALEIATNLAAAIWLGRRPQVGAWTPGLLLTLDVLFFSALLGLTGGPYNPFSFLYLVQIALGALVLSPLGSVGLAVLCFASDAALFAWHVWLPVQGQQLDPHELHHLRNHVQGMWIALAVASGFIVYFVQRVRRALADRERQLAAASSLALRNEKLASLATLSAGAAHGFSTPLSTIAVAARELERSMSDGGGPREWQDDIQLVRQQVDRCREILSAMATHAGESAGEGPEAVAPGEILRQATADLGARPHVALDIRDGDSRGLWVPPRVLARALHGIIRNAQQSAAGDSTVRVNAWLDGPCWVFEVADSGTGMSPAVVARAGEPFFTTKQPGEGMGLGLFLARTTAEQLGGRLEIDSRFGEGTTVRIILPTRESDRAAGIASSTPSSA